MAIDYFSLLSDDGWSPVSVDAADPRHFWSDGRPIADAPVDLAATFAGAIGYSTKLDPAFNLGGFRCPAGFTIPMHHLNHNQLTIVFGGSVDVEFLDREGDIDDERDAEPRSAADADGAAFDVRTVRAGQFFVIDAGTPFMMTAGADGVTFVESWREPVDTLETYWHDRGW